MKKNIKYLILITWIAIIAAYDFGNCSQIKLAAGTLANNQAAVEKSMETAIKQMLQPVLGISEITPVVRIAFAGNNSASNASALADIAHGKSVFNNSRLMKVSVVVLLGAKVDSEKLAQAKEIVITTFGLNLSNGDSFEFNTYTPPTSSLWWNIFDGKGFTFSSMLFSIAVLMTIILFVRLIKKLFRGSDQIQPAPRKRHWVENTTPEEDVEVPELKSYGQTTYANETYGEVQKSAVLSQFSLQSFITAENADDLKRALTGETPATVAQVIQRVDPELAPKVIPDGMEYEVYRHFRKITVDDPCAVEAVIERIRNRVICTFGGPARLGRIFQSLDKVKQDAALNDLKKNDPVFAQQVEDALFRFENILVYDSDSLKRVFRKAGIEAFVRCLVNCNDETINKFYEKLGSVIEALIKKHLIAGVIHERDSFAEKAVLDSLIELEKKGLITPFEKIKPSCVQN